MTTANQSDTRERIEELRKDMAERRRQLRELRRMMPEETVTKEYVFRGTGGAETTLTELFGVYDELIVVHNMGRACRYCTLWADGLNGLAPHFISRAAFVVISPDPPEVQRTLAASRGWQFDMWSTGPEFLVDMKMADEKGSPWPGISVFSRRGNGEIVRAGYDYFGPGDDYCAIWHVWDLFPLGIGGWEPREG